MAFAVTSLVTKKDKRGWLAEIITPDLVKSKGFGVIFLTVAKPGQIKGGHYHKRKIEWFCVIKGNGLLTLIENGTNRMKKIKMGEKNLIVVEIPPNHFHHIKNMGKTDMFLLIYVNKPFNPKKPDTFRERVF